MSAPPDRRHADRHPCVLRVQYRGTGHFLVSYCTNLSRGGLFVTTSDPLDVGTLLTLDLSIPGGETVEVNGRVAWVRAPRPDGTLGGMGLSFENVDTVLGDRIDTLVGDFTPLRVDIVSDPRTTWQHIAALVGSLVTCTTTHHPVLAVEAQTLSGADLVIVDLDADPDAGLELLADLDHADPRPPVLALCSARAVDVREAAQAHARVVPTPVDSVELQSSVLQTLTEVAGQVHHSGT